MFDYVILSCLIVFVYLFNIPFGYWRADTRRFSIQWILAIHLPVPLIFILRLLAGVDIIWIPVFVASFFLGQFTGSKIKKHMRKISFQPLSSCLFMDIVHLIRGNCG